MVLSTMVIEVIGKRCIEILTLSDGNFVVMISFISFAKKRKNKKLNRMPLVELDKENGMRTNGNALVESAH